MKQGIRHILALIIIVAALIGSIACVYHNGMGVSSYYEEHLDVLPVVEDIYLLEKGTVVEQLFSNSGSYLVGVDLVMLNTGASYPGTLYVQLCDHEGNLLAQKREELAVIEPGQFHTVEFLEPVDVSEYKYLYIRLYAEGTAETANLVAISPLEDVEDSIGCSINGGSLEHNLAIMYLYGKEEYVGYTWKTIGEVETLAASLILIVICTLGAIFLIYHKKKIKFKKFLGDGTCFKQILYIVWFFFVFLCAAVISKMRKGSGVPVWVYLYMVFTLLLTEGYYCYTKIREFNQKKMRRRVRKPVTRVTGNIAKKRSSIRKKFIRKNPINRLFKDKGVLIVLVCSILMRLPLFLNIQIWDGSIYYGCIQQLCNDFDFSLAYIWDRFRIASHYSIIFSFFVAIGEFLLPDKMTGVLLVLLILTEASLVCMYKMFRGYWLDLSQKEATIVTVLVSVCPLFLGLFSNVSLDNLLIVFAIFLFYAEYKNQTIMKIVWLVSIMMTKETGLVIVAGYLLVHIGVHLWKTIHHKKGGRVQYFLSDLYVMCGIGAAIVLCLYIIKQNGLIVWMGMGDKSSDNNVLVEYLRSFFDGRSLIIQKFKLLFVLHYQWIPVVAIIACLIYRFIKKRDAFRFKGQGSFYGTLGLFILLNIYLVSYALARYHIFSAVMIWILAVIILFDTFRDCLEYSAGIIVSMVLIVLLYLQNFYYIDPITNLAFDRYDTGKGKMIATEFGGGNMGDGFANNYRHTYLYGLVDTMLEQSGFDADSYVIIPYEKDYLYFHAYTGYDKNEGKRIFCIDPDEENVFKLDHAFLKDIEKQDYEKIPEKGVMYFLPYVSGEEEEYVRRAQQFYHVGQRQEVSNWGGMLAYYELEKK